jgi:hypothetical protein
MNTPLLDASKDEASTHKHMAALAGVRHWMKYHAGRCDEIVGLLAEGHSPAACAGAMDISYQTLLGWCDKYPEFRDAFDEGMAKRVLTLERTLLDTTNPVTANVRLRALGNATPEFWGSTQQTVLSGEVTLLAVLKAAAQPIQIEGEAA